MEDLLFQLEMGLPQIVLGLVNGAFYALLSLGLAVIFGMLHVINFAHGAQFMMGAFVAWMLLNWLGIGYWFAQRPFMLALAAILAAVLIGFPLYYSLKAHGRRRLAGTDHE